MPRQVWCGIRLTVVDVVVDKHLASTVTLVVVHTSAWPVDWELLKVGISMAVELRIEVREDTALQQRVFAKVNTADNVTGLELSHGSAEKEHRLRKKGAEVS